MAARAERASAGRARSVGGRERKCLRCHDPIDWKRHRPVGRRIYCSEACAVLAVADEASRTAWERTALELRREPCGPRAGAALALARTQAWWAQRRLDRLLAAGPHAVRTPWLWVPSHAAAAAALLAFLAWGSAPGYGPGWRAVAFAPVHSPIVVSRLGSPAGVTALLVPPPLPRPLTRPPACPSAPAMSDDITRGPATHREVAFTFDGGDEANIAPEILDALRARGVRATMFLTGQFIRRYPDLVRRMLAEGHEIGNHLDQHPHLTTYAQNHRQWTLPHVTPAFLSEQFERADSSLRSLTGRSMAPFWRAPYGEHNVEIRRWAARAGYRHVSWTRGASAEDLDTRDWVADRSSRIYRSREEIAAHVLEFGRGRPEGLSGGIILMHLATHRPADRPHEGLERLLAILQEEGYRVVPISELLSPKGQAAGMAASRQDVPGGPPRVH